MNDTTLLMEQLARQSSVIERLSEQLVKQAEIIQRIGGQLRETQQRVTRMERMKHTRG